MVFPSTGAILADRLGAKDAAAYDLSAGCTGFVYALVQAHGMVASGLARNALVIGGDVLSKIVDWDDRSTCVLFGDGAGAVVLERVDEGGFLGFELGADGSGGPAAVHAGGRLAMRLRRPKQLRRRQHFAKMNGREVFKFATRVLVDSAEKVLGECGVAVDDVDVYVPHQANVRIIELRAPEARHPGGEDSRERRPLWQHFVGLDPARARRCGGGRAARARRDRAA